MIEFIAIVISLIALIVFFVMASNIGTAVRVLKNINQGQAEILKELRDKKQNPVS
jgi:bacteriorhodopsin